MSPTTVIASLALAFAMTGGAYAAKKYLITSTKQISPSVLKALQGKAGPAGRPGAAGAQGAQGPQGPAGANGKDGANGTNGKDGASVANTEVKVGDASHCAKLGGAEFKVGAGIATFACNGKNGTTGFTETLPEGKTETGVWSVYFTASGANVESVDPISFNIPLAAGAEAHRPTNYIGVEEGEGEPNENTLAIPSHCKGTAENPRAVPGNVCVFAKFALNAAPSSAALGATFINPQTFEGDSTTGTDGFLLAHHSIAEGLAAAFGSWAVTAN